MGQVSTNPNAEILSSIEKTLQDAENQAVRFGLIVDSLRRQVEALKGVVPDKKKSQVEWKKMVSSW